MGGACKLTEKDVKGKFPRYSLINLITSFLYEFLMAEYNKTPPKTITQHTSNWLLNGCPVVMDVTVCSQLLKTMS